MITIFISWTGGGGRVKFLSYFPSEASTKFQEPRPVTLIDLLVSVFFFMRKFKSVAAKKM